jgi:hypothetical protein
MKPAAPVTKIRIGRRRASRLRGAEAYSIGSPGATACFCSSALLRVTRRRDAKFNAKMIEEARDGTTGRQVVGLREVTKPMSTTTPPMSTTTPSSTEVAPAFSSVIFATKDPIFLCFKML